IDRTVLNARDSAGIDFHRWRDCARPKGDDHASQTLACGTRRDFAGCRGIGTYFRLGLGWASWLAQRMAPRLVGSSFLRGRSRLRLWWLLRPRARADALGTPLAAGKSLLLGTRCDPKPQPTFGWGFAANAEIFTKKLRPGRETILAVATS